MLTKNYYAMAFAGLSSGAAEVTAVTGAKIIGGISSLLTGTYSIRPYSAMKTLVTSGNGVYIGSGRTKPTVNDTTIEEPITAGFTVTNPSDITRNVTPLFEEYTATYGITATEDITIGEICLISGVTINSTNRMNVLVDRTVLESPITVQTGEAIQLTYTIRFNYPTA